MSGCMYGITLNPAELAISPRESDEVPASLRPFVPLPDGRHLHVWSI